MKLPEMSTKKTSLRSYRKNNRNSGSNILNRQFKPKAPNLAWVSDITYIRTVKGICYLCVIIDLFSRKVIAWNVNSRQNTKLVSDTLLKAWNLRGHPEGVLFHSDRGTQYTSDEFRQLLDSINFSQSLSNTACPYDNAVVESFFKFLKKEEISRRKFLQLKDVKQSIMSYIDGFYNTKRPHSANNGLSPNEKEAEFWTKI